MATHPENASRRPPLKLAGVVFLILAALVAVYLVLGILYESLIHPLTIISTLPSAGGGAFLALLGTGTDTIRELSHWDKKALHNLKYFTWVEQQGKTSEDLGAMWEPDFWTETLGQAGEWDRLITQLNERTGVLKSLD